MDSTNIKAAAETGSEKNAQTATTVEPNNEKQSYILPERPKLGKPKLDPRDTFIVLLPGEPRSSIQSSKDYEFATTFYPDEDLRRRFVDLYRENLKKASIDMYNMRFDQPDEMSDALNIYVYLYEDDPTVRYRVEDSQHVLITTFFDTMEQCPLPNVPLYRQILVKNITTVMRETLLTKHCEQIKETLAPEFPEIRRVHVYSSLYLFARSDAFADLRDDSKRLAKIRKLIYSVIKKEDKDKILGPNDLKLFIDDIAVYNQIGGHNYFCSEYKMRCVEF
jgi:hypothetical protein